MNKTSDYIRENNKSKQILSKTSDVQNAYAQLKQMETEFSSILERYNTARQTLMNSTSTFIDENSRIPAESMLAKNIFVNKAVDNPQSKYVGIYKSNKNSNNITHLDGDYSYMDCQVAAINNGNKYFTLSDLNESSGTAQCSMTNSLSDITSGGMPLERCGKDAKDGNIYSNNMGSNALYKTNGNSFEYLGCYNDDVKNHAMNVSNSLTQQDVTPNVAVVGNAYSWRGGNFTTDTTAQLIWYQPKPPASNTPITMYTTYNYTGSSPKNVTISARSNNEGATPSITKLNGVMINNTLQGNWRYNTTMNASLEPGINVLTITVVNNGIFTDRKNDPYGRYNPGVILTAQDPNDPSKIFFNTTGSWKYSEDNPDIIFNNIKSGKISESKTIGTKDQGNAPNVYFAADSNKGPWGIQNFADPTAKWIWYTPEAASWDIQAPNNVGAPITLFKGFSYSGSGYIKANIRGHCDNYTAIYFNGKKLGELDDWWSEFNFQVMVQPGENLIAAAVVNEGGPAGFILTIMDANSNTVIVNSNTDWQYTSDDPLSIIPKQQNYSVSSCADYANKHGYNYFAVQGGKAGTSLCYVSNDLNAAKKYGSAEIIYKGIDGKTYGRTNVDATYEVKTPGDLTKLGKLGWMDNDGTLTEYPNSSYQVVNNAPRFLNKNNTCGKSVFNVDSIEWTRQLSKKSELYPTMYDNTKCGLSRKIQADQTSVNELISQLQKIAKQIIKIINYLEKLDTDTIKQVGINKSTLDNMLQKYKSYNSNFSEYVENENYTYTNIADDSKIVVAQKNYSYLLWSSAAIIITIITLIVIKNRQ
jgi:hypothetical protein